jgi:hypothetical protein
MRYRIFVVLSALIAVASVSTLAQQTFTPARSGVRGWEPYSPEGTRRSATKVIGSVIDIHQVPIAYASLILRNLATGLAEQQGKSNENGEYEFTVLQPSTYVVEMVVVDGNVLAISNAGSVGRYETLNTVVQLPGRWEAGRSQMVMPQNLSNYFGMSAQTSMTAATLQAAFDQKITPADAGEPVSPNF